MAVKFLPKPNPNKPMTFEDLRKHFHPKAPKDLLDKPLPSMHRKFVEVKTIDGYKYEEVWEVPTPKTEEPVEEEKDDVIDTLVSQYKEDLKRRIAQKKKK